LNNLGHFRVQDVLGNHSFPLATKWLVQAILSDAIKMGVGTACYEKLRDSCHNKVNAISVISNLLSPSMLQRDLGKLAPG
jgi:hypothetical protein